MISKKVSQLKPNLIGRIFEKTRIAFKKGKTIIRLDSSELDFNTPQHIKDAAKLAIDQNYTHYTETQGLPELREAICEKLKKENNVEYSPEEIVVTDGSKQALFNAFHCIFNEFDECIIPTPHWDTYTELLKLVNAKPVLVECGEDLKLQIEDLKNSITSKTKAILINSPSNPTGLVLSKSELKEIGDLAIEHDLIIISDESYEDFVYTEEKHVSISSLSESVKQRTILVNSASETYSMSGWRIGFSASNKQIAEAMTTLQSHIMSNASSISQMAYIKALKGTQDHRENIVKEFENRRDFVVRKLNEIPGVDCKKPAGGIFVFPRVSGLFSTEIKCAMELSDYLIEKYDLAVVPGELYGTPNHIRLCFAHSLGTLEEGLKRFEEAAKDIR